MAVGTAARMRTSTSSMARASAANDRPGSRSTLAATSSSSGPRCRVRMWMSSSTDGAVRMASAMASWSASLADSPMSRLFISVARTKAMTPSSRPIKVEPMPSQRPDPVMADRLTAIRAITRPTSAPESSSSRTGSSGAFERRMNCSHPSPGPGRVGLPHRGAEREALHHHGDQQDGDGPAGRVQLVGMQQLLDALEQGEHRAQGEQHDRDHERPEVPLAAVAERVGGGGIPARAAVAEQQQELVAGVGQGVHALGQHRRRPGEGEADELGHGDAQVGQQCGEHRLLAAAGGHGEGF